MSMRNVQKPGSLIDYFLGCSSFSYDSEKSECKSYWLDRGAAAYVSLPGE